MKLNNLNGNTNAGKFVMDLKWMMYGVTEDAIRNGRTEVRYIHQTPSGYIEMFVDNLGTKDVYAYHYNDHESPLLEAMVSDNLASWDEVRNDIKLSEAIDLYILNNERCF